MVSVGPIAINKLAQARQEVTSAGRLSEREALKKLRRKLQLSTAERNIALQEARDIVQQCRKQSNRRSLLDMFMSEFSLSTQEGIALLCICEALMRIPDDQTAEALIADKLGSGNWDEHLGSSDSLFINASTWALMLTGRIIRLGDDVTKNVTGWMKRLVSRLGETAAREAMEQGVQIVGNEFVVGQTIETALTRSLKNYERCSFDMLGEGARNYQDAERFFNHYLDSIDYIGKSVKETDSSGDFSVSIKLSAIHPRLEYRQKQRVLDELAPNLIHLALTAKHANVPLTIDAEEADRLELMMDILEALVANPEIARWDGLGLAVQGYSIRCYTLLGWLQALAEKHDTQFNVRLVKGAYWDTEIKQAQVDGLTNYPVFTRKPSTDLSWIVCAEQLFDSPNLIPQIATHNAFSMAAAKQISKGRPFEYQRLHGMGELLYTVAEENDSEFPPVRVYAPVGDHENLLSYLVRRLLENGANTSFVNRFLDEKCELNDVVHDPISRVDAYECNPHPDIPIPPHLYGNDRPNSLGLHLGDSDEVESLIRDIKKLTFPTQPVPDTHPNSIPEIFCKSRKAFESWNATTPNHRRQLIYKLAEELHKERAFLIKLMQEEAGKTLLDAVAEIREAIDFCHYYGNECVERLKPVNLVGPTGEQNQLYYKGRGVFVCISPWNFPLAIFLGQIIAALAAGNAVIAKPAEQTPKVAQFARRLMTYVGIPTDVVQLAFGSGVIGQLLIENKNVDGVAFTGSTATARTINLTLAQKDGPIVPFLAETGGINAMHVDSSILFEQSIDHILESAFQSAGQRCSALRLLCIQEEIFDEFVDALSRAMETLTIGHARDLATDLGPVIDRQAHEKLYEYVRSQRRNVLFDIIVPSEYQTTHIGPTIIEIQQVFDLQEEHFGPILHILKFKARERVQLLESISKSGYGLTFGVQSRIDQRAIEATEIVQAGNMYVNRNMIGATVGVQPFGGHGLSGTGPKAGGPNYLMRFVQEHVTSTNLVATGGNATLLNLSD